MDEISIMLHPNQSGFVPKRFIFNNIKLASTIISYAEITESDSAIMALDQEKAYNKIRHNYLWNTLEKFSVPPTFTKTIQELYKYAYTKVAINGIISQPYRVIRGVWQGDPLSCARFNLAIEPLACCVRSDNNLRVAFRTGTGWVGLDDTAPLPTDTVPTPGIHTYHTHTPVVLL